MEAVVIKAMNESYSEDRDIRNLLIYIARESKKGKEIRYYGGRGVSKEPQKAAKNKIVHVMEVGMQFRESNFKNDYHQAKHQ